MSLTIERISIVRGGRRVVDDVSFSVTRGETLVIIGANDAGKTTRLEGVLGFVPIMSGEVRFDNRLLQTLPLKFRP